jgi:mycofactocin system creatininase family protein
MQLGTATWTELGDSAPGRLLVPLGATEQHGPHLPLETDTVIATALARAVAAGRNDVMVAPALSYGSSGEHARFPGTLSLGQHVLEEVVVELVRSADHFTDVTLVAWHGGNAQPVARAVARLRAEGRRATAWLPRLEGVDAHAGRFETSLMLAIAPELVRDERPVGVTLRLSSLLPELQARGVKAVSPSGVLGDARGASAAEGHAWLARLACQLDGVLDAERVPAPA